MYILKEIANILKKTGNLECQNKGNLLELDTYQSNALHLRSLDLNASDMIAIASVLKQEKENSEFIDSISFSYNHLIGDSGVIALVRSLPSSISEVGLVNCGIGDEGGAEILKWMHKSPNLQMICVEQNNFSDKLKSEFSQFKNNHPKIMVVV